MNSFLARRNQFLPGLFLLLIVTVLVYTSRPTSAAPLTTVEAAMLQNIGRTGMSDGNGGTVSPDALEQLFSKFAGQQQQDGLGITLKNYVVHGDLNLSDRELNGIFIFSNCQFDGGIIADGLILTGDLTVTHCRILGSASFVGANISGNLNWCTTDVLYGKATFATATVDGALTCTNCYFSYFSIGGLHAHSVQVTDCEVYEGALFAEAAIDNNLDLYNDRFDGNVDFEYSSVGGDIVMWGTSFTSQKSSVDFQFANVDGSIVASGDTFDGFLLLAFFNASGNADFANATLNHDVTVQSTRIGGDLTLTGLKAGHGLSIVNTAVAGELACASMKCGSTKPPQHHSLYISHVSVGGLTSFNHADLAPGSEIEDCQFHAVSLFRPQGAPLNLQVTRVGYTDLLTVSEADGRATHSRGDLDSANIMEKLINASPYDGDNYTSLQEVYQRGGLSDNASAVYVEGHRRYSHYLSGFDADWDNFMYILTKYGTHPEDVLYWAVGFLFLGTVFNFKRNWMLQRKEPQDPIVDYNPFTYSLSLFLPFVDLDSSTVWRPNEAGFVGKLRLGYMRIHILAGWVLIPIAIGALSASNR